MVANVGVAASSVLVQAASVSAAESGSVVALWPVVAARDVVLDKATTTRPVVILSHHVHHCTQGKKENDTRRHGNDELKMIQGDMVAMI
jgi:hypothetical protein